jgi:hypothetical protein
MPELGIFQTSQAALRMACEMNTIARCRLRTDLYKEGLDGEYISLRVRDHKPYGIEAINTDTAIEMILD